MKSDPGITDFKLTESPGGILFNVYVQPRASRNEFSGVQGDEIKLRLTAPPVEDAANKLCIEFIARFLHVSKSQVAIVSGARSRHKTIKVTDVKSDAVLSILNDSAAKSSFR
jgi:hypothetical protein